MGIGRGEHWLIGAEDRSKKKKKKKRPRSCKQEAKTRCANIKSVDEKTVQWTAGGKSMWKEVRTQKRVRSLASNVIFVNRWNAPKLAWLKPSVYCNASHIFLTQSRLTNFFIINHNGWTMSGEIIRRILKEQKLIITVEKNALMQSPPPSFFFNVSMEIKRFFELTMNKIRGNNCVFFLIGNKWMIIRWIATNCFHESWDIKVRKLCFFSFF